MIPNRSENNEGVSMQPEEKSVEIYVAWDETGDYATGKTKDEALDALEWEGDGRLVRVKRYTVPIFIPVLEDGGELEPAI